MKRIALFTSQDIGFALIDELASRASEISLLVITDRTERDEANGYRDPIEACRKHHLHFIKAGRVSDKVVAAVTAFRPDLVLSAYYPHIIPKAVRDVAVTVNVHPGILPHYRGRFPTPYYILNGAAEFGIAMHEIDSGIDTGPVFVQTLYPMPSDITGHAFYRLTMDRSFELIRDNIDRIVSGQITAVPQSGFGSYYSSIERRFHIDWNLPVETIERRIRVHAKPYFPAYSFVQNKMVLLNAASIATLLPNHSAQGVGKIVECSGATSFVVSCSNGLLLVRDFEIAPPSANFALRAGMQLD